MNELDHLAFGLSQFADLSAEDFLESESMWQKIEYKKGDTFNEYRTVCKYLGFITHGVFRSYIIDEETGDEKNVFLYSGNQFVVPFTSFIKQEPCNYCTEAIVDASVLRINVFDLLSLYKKSHAWEHFGRLLAQAAFSVAVERTESLLFRTPEERYLDLLKQHPEIFDKVPLYHISSYLGIQGPSLSRIRKRISGE
jgi:CRP-like cAMP-binding protein